MTLQLAGNYLGSSAKVVLPILFIKGPKLYKGAIDSVYDLALGSLDCAQAAVSVVGSTWQRGLSGNLKEIAKASVGVSDLKNAKKALAKSSHTARGKSVKIPLSDRIGAAVGYVTNAAAKTALSSAVVGGAMTYAIGATRNALEMGDSANTFYAGAQLAATGMNMAAKAIAAPAFSGIGRGFVYFAKNPTGLANAAPLLASGTLLYAAAYEVENATASTGKVQRCFHGAMATLLAINALCVPGLRYAVGLSS